MAIYETVEYEPQILISAFERHHAEAQRYFAHRPQDLLELRVAEGESWERLCPFLGVEALSDLFPVLNQGFAH